MVKRYIIFIIGGGIGALINLAITYIMTEFFGLWYVFGYVLGGAANIVFNFIYHRRITFSVMDKAQSRFLKFIAVNIIIGIGSVGFIYLLTERLKLWYIMSGIIAITCMSMINFLINKLWVFRYKEINQSE